MELTRMERLIISNQLKILESLYPQEEEYYANQRKAIENGYKLHYDSIFVNISKDEMSEEDCQEILNILDMYRAITFSYEKLSDKNGINEEDIVFKGFDGHNETNKYLYTNYFIFDLKRFDELKYGQEFPDFSSHVEMLDTYKKMLNIWNKYPNKHNIDKNQIIELLKVD